MAVTNFIWDALSDNVLLETDENDATVVAYTHNPSLYGKLLSQDRGGVTSEYHYDGKNSTRQLTDENQNVTDTMTYSAFGEVVAKTGATTNSFGYKGAVGYYTNPETEDLYVRARTYEPTTGRWLSEDPLGFVDGPNLYRAYFAVNNIDPSGQHRIKIDTGNGDKVKDMPVFVDPAIDQWNGVFALNNICIRQKLSCAEDNIHVISGEIEIRLFITIPTFLRKVKDYPADTQDFFNEIYGHEQQHMLQVIKEIQGKNKQKIMNVIGHSFPVCDCESYIKAHQLSHTEEIWRIIGRAFTHPWAHGNKGGPGWGRRIAPLGFPKNYNARDGFPDRKGSGLPRNGEDGWLCTMDEVLAVKRAWPDWEFAPPGTYPPFETGHQGQPGHPLSNKKGEFFPHGKYE